MEKMVTPPVEAVEHKEKEEENELVISYLALRRWVGLLGFFLPVIVIAAAFILPHCNGLQNSLSDYHNTLSRDLFVGILCAIALFLSSYKGYTNRDKVVARIAGLFGFAVAIIPTGLDDTSCTIYAHLACGDGNCYNFPEWVGTVHLLISAVFLLILAYFSFYIFTWSDKEKDDRGKQKRRRNRLYRTCGVIIALCVLSLIFYFVATDADTRIIWNARFKPVLVFEVIAVWAFAISWLIKGKTLGILQDKK